MKTLQSLFVGEKNQHPVYNNVDKRVVSDLVSRDSNLSGAYGYRKITDIPDAHKNDFGIDEFIQTLFFPNSVERDGGDLQAKATYEEKVVQAKRLFSSAPGTFYGPDLGLTAWSDDDSAA